MYTGAVQEFQHGAHRASQLGHVANLVWRIFILSVLNRMSKEAKSKFQKLLDKTIFFSKQAIFFIVCYVKILSLGSLFSLLSFLYLSVSHPSFISCHYSSYLILSVAAFLFKLLRGNILEPLGNKKILCNSFSIIYCILLGC